VGNQVIEVRVHGITKARVVAQVLSAGHPDAILAIGDDRTDEDLFTALPEEAVTVRVGPGPTRARYRLPSVSAVRGLLRRIAQCPPNGK
jgi:trehalose 6-phosphate synthase/phosphatase